jgi:hypothetical protein
MAKKQTFADKLSKAKGSGAAHCPVCGEIFTSVKVREFVSAGDRRKMVSRMVKTCKCNNAAVYG